MSPSIVPNSTILFQGDSITDASRTRETEPGSRDGSLGSGYAMMTAARLLVDRPRDGLQFLNRGISGNRIVDLYARIRTDTLRLKPDVLSVLIGVNDTWHRFSQDNGVELPKFERLYRDYLNEVREAIPAVRFVLCEPFVLECGVVTGEWVAEMDQRREVVRKLADEFEAIFVPFQSVFDDAVENAAPDYWLPDGVHPSPAGHLLMARAWCATVV